MKKIAAITIYLLLFPFGSVYSQEDLSIEHLQKISEQKSTIVYVTGLWCLPCMKKLKKISDSLLLFNDNRHRYIVVFDRVGFDTAKLKKLSLTGFDTKLFFLIPKNNYSKSFIQFNPSNKALKNYISRIKKAYHSKINFEKFWFSDAILINENKLVFPISSE